MLLLYKAAATEVRCGIELSPCSVASPSGTIYTSLWPHLCIKLRGGTSVGWPLDRVRICISDDATHCRDGRVYTSTFDVANGRPMEGRG